MHGTTLVFDLDGTLVDTAPDLIGATNHALGDVGLAPVPGGALKPWIGFGARRMIVEALRIEGRELPEPEVDRLLDAFLAHYEANIARESRPFEGVPGMIEACRRDGARIALCTNKRESLSRALLDALGLSHLFDGLAGRDTFPVSKPHPDHLLGAIRLAGGDARRAVMIGDSRVDIDTARAAGVPVIGCTFGYSETPVHELGPDAVMGHYRELRVLAGRLLAVGVAGLQQ
jgi:phosphoglycolate phosphatase